MLAIQRCKNSKNVVSGVTLDVIESEPVIEFFPASETTFQGDGNFDFNGALPVSRIQPLVVQPTHALDLKVNGPIVSNPAVNRPQQHA